MYPSNEETQQLAKRMFLNDINECSYFPKYFTLQTINICNAKCIMCHVPQKTREPEIIDEQLFIKFVNEVKPYSEWIKSISMFGDNEPLLDKRLPERVGLLKEKGIKFVTLSTNG